MGKKSIPVVGALLFLATFWWGGCGSSGGEGDEGEGTVFDTVPVFEKDTFLYPLATRSSSYMFPEVSFGEVKTIDGDPNSAWQTIPGLVTGEYIEFDFDSLFIHEFDVLVVQELRLARIKNLRVYVENRLLGTYPPNMRIPLGRKVNSLRIELGETDGINKIDIPFKNDSTQNVLTLTRGAESVYSSKSGAIFEIVFFKAKDVEIPLRSLPVKKAKINPYGVTAPAAMNNPRLLFDGRKGFGWRGPADAKDKTLLFSFDADQIINGLFFPFTENLNVSKIGFRLRKRTLPEYTVAYKGGNGIFLPLKNTLKGKNFELVILETSDGKDPYIPELLFHDGSRLFSIYSDSLEIQQKARVDSSKNTTLQGFLDSRVTAFGSEERYAHPLQQIFSKDKKDKATVLKDTLPTGSADHRISFRICSNGTFIVEETRKRNEQGPPATWSTLYRKAEGYWLVKSKGSAESVITCFAELREESTYTSPPNAPRTTENLGSIQFDVVLERNGIRFSNYFSGMVTGY